MDAIEVAQARPRRLAVTITRTLLSSINRPMRWLLNVAVDSMFTPSSDAGRGVAALVFPREEVLPALSERQDPRWTYLQMQLRQLGR